MNMEHIAKALSLYVAWMTGGDEEKAAYKAFRAGMSFEEWDAMETLYHAVQTGIGEGKVLHGI